MRNTRIIDFRDYLIKTKKKTSKFKFTLEKREHALEHLKKMLSLSIYKQGVRSISLKPLEKGVIHMEFFNNPGLDYAEPFNRSFPNLCKFSSKEYEQFKKARLFVHTSEGLYTLIRKEEKEDFNGISVKYRQKTQKK